MKRKIFSTLLMGAFVIASMSMFTSCKDYDDDINDLQKQIDALPTTASLTTLKTELESEISTLKTQLETAEGNITALTSSLATKADKTALADEVTRATAAEAALGARLTTAESALTTINSVLANKVDKSALNDSIVKIYGRIEAVETGLGKVIENCTALKKGLDDEVLAREAVAADVAQQKIALDNFETRLKALETSNSELSSSLATALSDIATLKDQVKAAQDQLDANTEDIKTLKSTVEALSAKIDKVQASVNTLNVLLDQVLRSLVFIPESYYWGIEATKLLYLEFNSYTLPEAAWNVKEAKGYEDDVRYACVEGTKVLSFAATYHMNPSSADLSKASVAVLSNDLVYENTRSAACGLSVKDWNTTTPGILTVNLDVKDPSLIKSVKDDQMVTNFATQVTLKKKTTDNSNDTTITSDYATLYKFTVKDLKLAHAANTETNPINLYSNASKSALSPCALEADYGHLMQTVHEAGVTFAPQDSCNWNSTIDLRNYVKIHYTDKEGNHAVLTDAQIAANFDVKFELTAFYNGNNSTDESAHAAIASDGYTFRPQPVTADGKQQTYGVDQVRASELGRTPVVRVTLVDKDTKKVYDYGYIRIKITEAAESPVIKGDKHIDYTGTGYTYSGECTYPAWKYQTTWNITEYDLYVALGLSREEFEANYGAPVGDPDDLTQFSYDAKTNKFTQLESKIGTASTVTDKTPNEDGTMSSTLKWEMTGAQAYKFFVTDKKGGDGVAIKYESKDKSVGPDVYVFFKTKNDVTINTPKAVVDWNALKNSTVWAATNAAATGTGLNEIHVNVPSVEDNKTTTAEPFEKVFSDVFVGNKINAAKIITSIDDKTATKEYAAANLTLDLIFDVSNIGAKYMGVDGKTYYMSLSDDAKTLYASQKADNSAKQVVAIINTGDVNAQKIAYQHTEYAHNLLNYVAHNALNDNTLKAVIGLKAVNKCNKPLTLTNNTFDVRFLRPINVTNTAADVEDAATTELQTIDLIKLLTFTDWRDAWKGENPGGQYYKYYGIQGVSVAGVADGAKISTNPDVLTDQNGNTTMVALQSVNGAIDFTYNAGTSTLTYKNYSSTTADFKVQIPVVVKYLWGSVPQTITVNVKHTHANAKKY
jgi:peptidoglycan hydrolase CwlO-like protein